jgi:hypothetical protein
VRSRTKKTQGTANKRSWTLKQKERTSIEELVRPDQRS